MREAFAAMPTFEWLLAGMDPLVFLHTEESSTLFFCTSLSKYIISRFTKTAAAATQQNLIRVDKNKPRVADIYMNIYSHSWVQKLAAKSSLKMCFLLGKCLVVELPEWYQVIEMLKFDLF